MNKKDLVNEIQQHLIASRDSSPSKFEVEAVVNALGKIAQAHLTAPDAELTLPGIGKLVVVAKPARTGRNPGTGVEIEIAAHNVVKFRPAKELKDSAK
jgi:DNA-binding protein HU-beta